MRALFAPSTIHYTRGLSWLRQSISPFVGTHIYLLFLRSPALWSAIRIALKDGEQLSRRKTMEIFICINLPFRIKAENIIKTYFLTVFFCGRTHYFSLINIDDDGDLIRSTVYADAQWKNCKLHFTLLSAREIWIQWKKVLSGSEITSSGKL